MNDVTKLTRAELHQAFLDKQYFEHRPAGDQKVAVEPQQNLAQVTPTPPERTTP